MPNMYIFLNSCSLIKSTLKKLKTLKITESNLAHKDLTGYNLHPKTLSENDNLESQKKQRVLFSRFNQVT